MPGATFEVTGAYEDCNESNPLLRFRVPSLTPVISPTSQNRNIAHQRASSRTVVSNDKVESDGRIQSSLQSVSSAIDVTTSVTLSTRVPSETAVSSFGPGSRPSSIVIVPADRVPFCYSFFS